jgi:DNA-binding HxlR family transcriptional regulator
MQIDQDVFSELLNLLPIIQETSLECLRRELGSFEHDGSRMSMEREGFLRFFRFLQRKWAIDIMYVLLVQEELHFNEIRRLLEGVSSRTLTDRLVELGERGVIGRKVQRSRPVMVKYSLTDFGRGLVALLVPVFLYASSHQLHSS